MKSLCFKTNNNKIISYLLKSLETSSLENIYFTHKEFKCYKNVIVHYLGNSMSDFLNAISEILTDCILIFYEPFLFKKLLDFHYFYFDDFEKNIIEQNCYDYISLEENNTLKYRKDEVWTKVLEYIEENKSIILDGFVTFRLKDYILTLEEVLDYSVQQYVIDKEYNEFINLLKIYIDSKLPTISLVHLVYTDGESILLDEDKNIININNSISNATYLSDISFSSNDYALNSLLTLLPRKIEIHLCSDYEDDFINTLKLIFCNRVSICKDCNLCKTYKLLNNVKHKN